MLRFMRKHATGYMIKAMFGIIIIVFIFWGVGSFRETDKTVAEIGPHKVSAMEYQETYNNVLNYYRMLYRDKFDENMIRELKLKEKVMDQLVDKYVLLIMAEEMGVRVSDKEFTDYLSGMEAFRRNGKFDEKAYAETLKRNNIEPKTFEEKERQAMVVAKLANIIQDNGAGFDEKAAYQSYLKENGQIKLSMAVFDAADYTEKTSVDEKELNDLYEKEKSVHRSPNLYHLKYLVIDGTSGLKDDQVYMELLKTKDLAAYGKTKGVEVVDVGTLKENDVASRFARLNIQERLKGMVKGDISLPVRDGNKSYIFQIIDQEGGKPLERDEVLKLLKTRLVNEKARRLARTKAEDAIKDKGTKFSKETGFLSRNATLIVGIGQIPKEHVDILALGKGQRYQKPVEIGGKYYLFSCEDEKVPDKAQWEKDKEVYKQIFAAKARDAFLTTFKEDAKKQIKVKVDWQSV